MELEEFRKQASNIVGTSLQLPDEASANLTRLIDEFEPCNDDLALVILDAYKKGVDLFFHQYMDTNTKLEKANSAIDKVKNKLFDEYLNE